MSYSYRVLSIIEILDQNGNYKEKDSFDLVTYPPKEPLSLE